MSIENDEEVLGLLKQAADEIRVLRRQLELAKAKVEVMDLFKVVLTTQPSIEKRGESIDLAWKIDRFIFNHEELNEATR